MVRRGRQCLSRRVHCPLQVALAQHGGGANREAVGVVRLQLLDRVRRLLGHREFVAGEGEGPELDLGRQQVRLLGRGGLEHAVSLGELLGPFVDQSDMIERIGILRVEPQDVAELDHRLGILALLVQGDTALEEIGLLLFGGIATSHNRYQ